MRSPLINVEVHFLKPICAVDQTRDELSLHAFEEVVVAIKEIKHKYRGIARHGFLCYLQPCPVCNSTVDSS